MTRSHWLAVLAGALLACNASDDTVAPNPNRDAGNNDATTTGSDGAVTPASSMCAKYGGFANVQGVAKGLLDKVKADCKIGAYFTGLALSEELHFTECFALQLGELMGCEGKVYAGSKDSRGQLCRSMAEAHQIDPRVRTSDLDAFVIDAVAVLQSKGLASADAATIGAALRTTKDVVQSDEPGNAQSICPGADAGQDAAIADADDAG
jgi:hypothetical protein